MLETTILEAFEKVWDIKIAEISAQRKQTKECKEKGEEVPSLRLIDFSQLNLLAFQILKMTSFKTDKDISAILENMPSKDKTIKDYERYFEYALFLARFIEQDTSAVIADIVKKNKK